MIKTNLAKSLALSAALVCSFPTWAAKEVTIGYQSVYNPMAYAIDTKKFEEKTGYEIKWRKFDSGAKAITAMASGAVDMTGVGSSAIASATSRGIDLELVWVLENIADAEALVVKSGSGIEAPSDLKGKRIAVPLVSTTHFHMLFALEQFGLTEKDVKLINMQPNAIMAAWQRGDIDGAYVWDPALGKIKQDGKVLISSKQLSSWGKSTFDGLVASKEFSQENPEFIQEFLTVLAQVDEEYRTKQEQENITEQSPMVQSVAKVIGGDAKGVVDAMSLYEFLDPAQQSTCQWLGCGEKSGAGKAIQQTAEFLYSQKKITDLQEDYTQYVNSSYVEALKDQG